MIRSLGHEHRHDQRVDSDALAAAGRAGDEHVRHERDVLDERIAAGVLADEDGQGHLGGLDAAEHDQLLQADLLLVDVGHLDADRVLAGYRRDDTDGIEVPAIRPSSDRSG